MEQGDGYAGRVGFGVVVPHEPGPDPRCALGGQHESLLQVSGRGEPGERGDPGGGLRALGGHEPDRYAVSFR